MLSYQHEYHAGNHADVLKHGVLAILIRALQRKPAPIRVLDSHAGSGLYDLDAPAAQQGREHERGIAPVLARAAAAPAALAPYLETVARLNPGGRLRRYPGSARLAFELLREQDELELFELHPQASAALRAELGREPKVHIHRRDGFEGLVAVVPPRERRGIALVDPSYERKSEFDDVASTIAAAQKRWAGGVYMVWYPLISNRTAARFAEHGLRQLAPRGLYRVELAVAAPDSKGLRGSGLLIFNLPHRVDAELNALLPWLHATLAPRGLGGWRAEPVR